MNTINKVFSVRVILILSVLLSGFSSCKKFVELGPPPSQTVLTDVFKTDATATSAILGLYSSSNAGATALVVNYSVLPGMSADDVQMSVSSAMYDEFKTNTISSTTNNVNANLVWFPGYQVIKNANDAISGLTSSQTLTPAVKDQLLGEAKTIRALAYFYLVNFYGDVPLPLKDDSQVFENAVLPRTAATLVWGQIIADLKEAVNLLPATYLGTFKGRINKWAASTLLARAYLYTKDYANAETEANKTIASGTYTLPVPANAFVNTSNEIIWQIANITGVSLFGSNYLPASATTIPTYILYDTVFRSFEATDLRKTSWTGLVTVGGKNYYYVNKYKVRTGTGNEYNVVFRFAELYLIRAEARAQLNKISDAKADLDLIRSRAGLAALSPTLNQAQMLLAIEQERKVELFGEWGHRWFDLKRTNRADAVIGGQKASTWKPAFALYPIPEPQRIANPNLTQNAGY